jgi:predicted Zn-dependent protease
MRSAHTAALLIVTTMFPCSAFAAFPAPPPSPVISPTQEVVLGERALQQYLVKHPQSADAELSARVDAIGRRVALRTDRPDVLHTTMVVTSDVLQAVSFLGGSVCVTEDLARALDDDELAFALGHEMAHIDLRHRPARVAAEDVVREAFKEPAAVDAALSVHDRHAELEADKFGALYAVRAGYRFSSAVTALHKLADSGGLDSDPAHPNYLERLSALAGFETELRRTITAFERGCAAMKEGRVNDAVEYFTLFVAEFPSSVAGRINLGAAYLTRWRENRGSLEGLAEELPILADAGVTIRGGFSDVDGRNARLHFEAALRIDPQAPSARAGMALMLLRERATTEARGFLLPLESDPELRPEVLLLLGNADYLDGAWGAAASRYDQALSARPGWSSARANLARTLARGGRPEESRAQWELLRDDPVWGAEAQRQLAAHVEK